MISSKKAGFLVVVLGLLVPLAAAASDSGSCIASMSASLDSPDSVVLIAADASEETVTPTPTTLTLVGDEGELKGTVSITPSTAGPFTSVRVTLSSISFTTFVDCASGGLTASPTTLTVVIPFEEDDEADDTEEITAGSPVNLEISFSPEDGLVSDPAGCFTGTFVADPSVAFEAELEDDAGDEEELELAGEVAGVASPNFGLDVNGDGATDYTIHTDGTTQFQDPLTGLSGLAPGDLVRVEIKVMADGTLHATKVELLFDESASEAGATGRIACVDSSTGATSITLVFAASAPDHPFASATVQVNLDGGTNFKVNAGNINTSGFDFDADNLSPGQRITAAGTPVSGGDPPQVDGNKLILKLQEVEGLVVGGSVNTGAGTFELTITSASDVLLTEPITVKVFPNTKFTGQLSDLTSLNTTDTYQVKGLLMRDPAGTESTDVVFLAKKIKKKTGNAP